jgi:hypothetical protein
MAVRFANLCAGSFCCQQRAKSGVSGFSYRTRPKSSMPLTGGDRLPDDQEMYAKINAEFFWPDVTGWGSPGGADDEHMTACDVSDPSAAASRPRNATREAGTEGRCLCVRLSSVAATPLGHPASVTLVRPIGTAALTLPRRSRRFR